LDGEQAAGKATGWTANNAPPADNRKIIAESYGDNEGFPHYRGGKKMHPLPLMTGEEVRMHREHGHDVRPVEVKHDR